MTVKELREVLATLDDDVYVLVGGADVEVVTIAGDQVTLDDDRTYHMDEDGKPIGSYSTILWSIPELEV